MRPASTAVGCGEPEPNTAVADPDHLLRMPDQDPGGERGRCRTMLDVGIRRLQPAHRAQQQAAGRQILAGRSIGLLPTRRSSRKNV